MECTELVQYILFKLLPFTLDIQVLCKCKFCRAYRACLTYVTLQSSTVTRTTVSLTDIKFKLHLFNVPAFAWSYPAKMGTFLTV
jgi:hypothetical protein